jgi:hypothetical protein
MATQYASIARLPVAGLAHDILTPPVVESIEVTTDVT